MDTAGLAGVLMDNVTIRGGWLRCMSSQLRQRSHDCWRLRLKVHPSFIGRRAVLALGAEQVGANMPSLAKPHRALLVMCRWLPINTLSR